MSECRGNLFTLPSVRKVSEANERKVDEVNVRNEGKANIPIKREKWSLLQFPNFSIKRVQWNLFLLPSGRKVDEVNVRNEGKANAEKAIYRRPVNLVSL